jgi:ribonucleases P/MRP protein subunit RPP40
MHRVDSHSDGPEIQNDLQRVEDWANQWQMKFNINKCKVLHYGIYHPGFTYMMCGQPLEESTVERDLGVTMSSDLKVGIQCRETYCKSSQILGLINRTIKYKNPGTLISLYKFVVRPHLEYCSSACNP